MRKFSDYNPIVTAVFFGTTIGISMFSMNPVMIFLSLFGAVLYFLSQNGKKEGRTHLFYAAVFFVTAGINPLVSHNGVTVLLVVNDNPITLEAVIYGVFAALTLVTALYWFRCFSGIMTGDKLLYLFGGLSPRLSLVLSMSLRFVPLFREYSREAQRAQTALGLYKEESIIGRIKGGAAVFSSTVSWALENGIVTADSMAARGYGVGKRTFFSDFRVTRRDIVMLFSVVTSGLIVVIAKLQGAMQVSFYPAFEWGAFSLLSLAGYLSFGVLCLLPVAVEIGERIRWSFLKSKI